MRYVLPVLLFTFAATSLHAQFAVPQEQRPRVALPLTTPEEFVSNRPSTSPTSANGQDYIVGKDDLLEVTVFEIPELSGTPRVTASGLISLPLVGTIEAAGYSAHELERKIEEGLKRNYVLDPHVTVFVREYASQPVTLMGAVKAPGIYQIKGEKFLLEMLAMAGGLDPLSAGNAIQIMRRADTSGAQQTIRISIEDLVQNGNSELNVPIKAGDTIQVMQAGSIFVIGEVVQPGEFVLRNGRNVTTSQAIGLAHGFGREPNRGKTVIFRIHSDGTKEEIPVNIAKILDGSKDDVTLLPNDILFVPSNKVKTGINKALETAIATLSARVVYRF